MVRVILLPAGLECFEGIFLYFHVDKDLFIFLDQGEKNVFLNIYFSL